MRLKFQMSLLSKVTAVAVAAAGLELGINNWIFLNMIKVILQSLQDPSTRRRTLVQTNIAALKLSVHFQISFGLSGAIRFFVVHFMMLVFLIKYLN